MRGKIAKQIRKYIRDMYPKVEKENPLAFNRMCRAIKDEYENTPIDSEGKIMKQEEK